MNKKYLLPIFLFVSLSAFSQERKITAQVLDSETKKPIKNATVIIHETTAGTVANVVGFFELTLAPAQTTIIISSIGYVTSKIDVPSANQFKIFLDKEYIELPILDFKTMRAMDSLAIEQPIKLGGESDAWYPGGWKEFYLDFYRALKADSVVSKMDTTFNLKFSVSPDGEVVNINCSYPEITPNLLKAFNGMHRFEAALQNGLKVSQYYSIIISVNSLIDVIYTVIEVSAEPKGGLVAFYRFIGENLKYPPTARRLGIQGQVFVEFTVNRDGSISDARVLKGIGGGCDEEALRVLSLSPNWLPGTQRGKPVRQKMIVPIIFKLG